MKRSFEEEGDRYLLGGGIKKGLAAFSPQFRFWWQKEDDWEEALLEVEKLAGVKKSSRSKVFIA